MLQNRTLGGVTRPQERCGATVVEFALVTPVVFVIFFGAVEFSRVNVVRHTIDVAAYEGARRGIVPGATAADVEARVAEVLSNVAIANSTVTVTPATLEGSSDVTVDVLTPMNNNGFISGTFMKGQTLSGQSTLAREGYTAP